MRSKTMAIMAAAVLFLPTVAHAQPSEGSAASWTFAVLTIWQAPHQSNIKREPYGVFTSQDDCDMARAKKIVELDSGNYRLPHLLPDAPVITTTVTVGARSITKEVPGGPIERMYVTNCTAEKFFVGGRREPHEPTGSRPVLQNASGDISPAGSQTAQKN